MFIQIRKIVVFVSPLILSSFLHFLYIIYAVIFELMENLFTEINIAENYIARNIEAVKKEIGQLMPTANTKTRVIQSDSDDVMSTLNQWVKTKFDRNDGGQVC